MIAGSLDDAVESRDIWTFSRRIDRKLLIGLMKLMRAKL